MIKTQKQHTSANKFKVADVVNARFLSQGSSRLSQFRSAERAYVINPDGSISSRREFNSFK